MRFTRNVALGLLWATGSASVRAQQQDGDWDRQMSAGRLALQARRYADADRLFTQAVHSQNPDGSQVRLGLALAELGLAKASEGQLSAGAAVLRRGIGMLETAPGFDSQKTAPFWQVLGTALYRQSLYAEAERAYDRGLAAIKDADRALTAEMVMDLVAVYQAERRNGAASEALNRARLLVESADGIDPLAKVNLLNHAGALWRAQGRHSEAQSAFLAALHELDRTEDRDGMLTVSVLSNLALEEKDAKRYEAAAANLDRAITRMETGTSLSRGETARVLDLYQHCLRKSGQSREARAFSSRASAILQAASQDATAPHLIDASQLKGR